MPSKPSLERLVRCTEQMLESAGKGDWDAVELLARERDVGLADCFAGQDDSRGPRETADAIAALLVLNDRLVAQVADARSSAMDQLATLKRQRQGHDSYGQVQEYGG
ncbi:MAG: hypothetical protein QNI86_03730 [Halieaceae bacterium]|nr:hypothetical protein [Halieaceae bacterium]